MRGRSPVLSAEAAARWRHASPHPRFPGNASSGFSRPGRWPRPSRPSSSGHVASESRQCMAIRCAQPRTPECCEPIFSKANGRRIPPVSARLRYRATGCFLRRCGMVDQSADEHTLLSPVELPLLLEWYASHCFALAEQCEQRHAARWLRLLSVDLVLSADQWRRQVRNELIAK